VAQSALYRWWGPCSAQAWYFFFSHARTESPSAVGKGRVQGIGIGLQAAASTERENHTVGSAVQVDPGSAIGADDHHIGRAMCGAFT
jgi:hypothetical protein